jgi:iron complex outermembrane recepter protein
VGGKTYTNYDCAGLYGVSCGTPTPSWRHTARVTWSTPISLDVSLNWRHISGSKFDGNTTNPFLQLPAFLGTGTFNHIAAFDYLDVGFSYNLSEKIQLSAGVNNVLDRNPPTLSSGGQTSCPTGALNGNTFNGVYDSLGRYMFVGITLKS